EDLRRLARVRHRRLARDELGQARLHLERHARIELARGVVRRQTRGVDTRLHAGDRELDVLVAADRGAEHTALLGVAQGLLEAALRGARAQRGERDPALVERLDERREAASDLAQQVLL